MSRKSYWLSSLEAILDEHEIVLDPTLVAAVADDLVMAAEMESEACGYTNIPNPQDAVIKNLKLAREQDQIQARAREDLLCKDIAQRITNRGHGYCDPRNVTIHNGQVEIWSR